MSKTKTYKLWKNFFLTVSILLTTGPALYYLIKALSTEGLVVQKVGLVSCVMVALILTAVAAVNKCAYKSRLWIVLVGLALCIDKFAAMVLVFAITQIIDELVIAPLYTHYKQLYTINKEIDARQS